MYYIILVFQFHTYSEKHQDYSVITVITVFLYGAAVVFVQNLQAHSSPTNWASPCIPASSCWFFFQDVREYFVHEQSIPAVVGKILNHHENVIPSYQQSTQRGSQRKLLIETAELE